MDYYEKAIVLIVVDNANDDNHLCRTLEQINYKTIICECAVDDVRYSVLFYRPDLILIDALPNGENDCLKLASSIVKQFDIPFIFLSDSPEKLLKKHDVQDQLFNFIEKPFNKYNLHANIQMVIARNKLIRKLRESELELKENKNQLQILFSHADDPIFVWNKKGAFLKVNEQACGATGYIENELLQMNVMDIDMVYNSPSSMEDMFKSLQPHYSMKIKTLHRKKNNTTYPVELKLSLIQESGEPYVIGIASDISNFERQRNIQASLLYLFERANNFSSDEILGAFLDQAEILTKSEIGFYHFVHDDQKNLSLQMWSTRTMDICTAPGKDTHYPIESAGVWVDCVSVRAPVVHNDYEKVTTKKGLPPGHVPLVRELVVPVIRGNKVRAILGVGNKNEDYDDKDVEIVTQLAEQAWETIARKRTEEQLRENEEKLRSILGSMIDPVIISDHKNQIEYINPAMASLVGYDAIGKTCYNVIHGFDKECPWCQREKVESGKAYYSEINSPKNNRDYIITNSPIFNEDNTISQLGIYRDITRERQSQKEKEKLRAQLQQAQKMEAIGTLAGGIAHDFNNILSAIIGYGQLVEMDLPDEHPVQNNLAQMLKACSRASDLVRQILRFSRQSKQEATPMEVGPVVKEAIKLIRATTPATVEIQHEINADAGAVLADPTQIHQVMMNLCANACHAMGRSGGVLTLQLEKIDIEDKDALYYGDFKSGPFIRLSVSDTGYGIDKEQMKHIFDPFFTTKDTGEGTGLGLSVVHGIVNELNGAIKVYSEPGEGSTFQVYLPRLEGKASDLTETSRGLTPIGTEHILFVDDEEALVEIGKQLLEHLGYRFTGMTSSIEALKLFNSRPYEFDLVITDQTMPKMTGWDMSREMLQVRPEIPIIVCSGFSEQLLYNDLVDIGIKRFLMKPLVINQLATSIREVLD